MNTFAMGGVVLHDIHSLDEAIAAAECINRLNRSREEREYLRKISHGHVFPLGAFDCECGMSRIDYFTQSHTGGNPLCKSSQAKLLNQDMAGAEFARLDRCHKGTRGDNESQV